MLDKEKNILVFCDASVSSKENLALGSYLILEAKDLERLSLCELSAMKEFVSEQTEYVQFETHKSTLAEIKTFLYVIKKLRPLSEKKICFYTDCQSLHDLFGVRRQKLIKAEFKKKDGSPLPHGEMYREIIGFFTDFSIEVVKVKGHSPKHKRTNIIDKIFSVVDQLSRKKLRQELIDN